VPDPKITDPQSYHWVLKGTSDRNRLLCRVYQVTPRRGAKTWNFAGTVFVPVKDHVIVPYQGIFLPFHSIRWSLLREELNIPFEVTFVEIQPGVWVPGAVNAGIS